MAQSSEFFGTYDLPSATTGGRRARGQFQSGSQVSNIGKYPHPLFQGVPLERNWAGPAFSDPTIANITGANRSPWPSGEYQSPEPQLSHNPFVTTEDLDIPDAYQLMSAPLSAGQRPQISSSQRRLFEMAVAGDNPMIPERSVGGQAIRQQLQFLRQQDRSQAQGQGQGMYGPATQSGAIRPVGAQASRAASRQRSAGGAAAGTGMSALPPAAGISPQFGAPADLFNLDISEEQQQQLPRALSAQRQAQGAQDFMDEFDQIGFGGAGAGKIASGTGGGSTFLTGDQGDEDITQSYRYQPSTGGYGSQSRRNSATMGRRNSNTFGGYQQQQSRLTHQQSRRQSMNGGNALGGRQYQQQQGGYGSQSRRQSGTFGGSQGYGSNDFGSVYAHGGSSQAFGSGGAYGGSSRRTSGGFNRQAQQHQGGYY